MLGGHRKPGTKRAVNLSLDADLLQAGKDLGLNLSAVAEEALAYAVSARLAEGWAAFPAVATGHTASTNHAPILCA